MRINQPRMAVNGGLASYRVVIEFERGPKELYFEISSEYASLISLSADAALVGILLQAMYLGEDIDIEAPVSSELLWNLQLPFQQLMKEAIPVLKIINIRANQAYKRSQEAEGVAVGFSGGIDSFSTVADYLSKQVPGHLKLTHLVYNNVGSHGKGAEKLFEERYKKLSVAAGNLGLPFVKCNSNLDEFYSRRMNFELTNTVRNAAAAMVLQNGIGTHLYSSSYGFRDITLKCGNNMAHLDPISLPYLSNENLRFISAGAHLYRVDKTVVVSDFPEAFNSLDVCVSSKIGNCSKCFKCLRTLLTLEICGSLDKFKNVFDLNRYRRYRIWYMTEVLVSRDSFCEEIRIFARGRNFKFPLLAYLAIPISIKAIKSLPIIVSIRNFKKSLKK